MIISVGAWFILQFRPWVLLDMTTPQSRLSPHNTHNMVPYSSNNNNVSYMYIHTQFTHIRQFILDTFFKTCTCIIKYVDWLRVNKSVTTITTNIILQLTMTTMMSV